MGSVVRAALVGAAAVGLGVPVGMSPNAATAGPAASGQARPPVTVAVRTRTEPPCPAGLVALTFDDGPARGVTPRLVGILQDRHVPATFFMVGSRVRTAPRGARLVARAGFTIGNHTWSHPHLTRLTDAQIRREIRRTARELRRQGIEPSTLMRPPYGDIDGRVRAVVRDLGLVPVLWTVDPEDWRGGTARQIASSILRQLRPHATNIVLQHDGVPNSPASVSAVPIVIRAARRRGYCFGSLGPHGRVIPAAPPADVVGGSGSSSVGRLPGAWGQLVSTRAPTAISPVDSGMS